VQNITTASQQLASRCQGIGIAMMEIEFFLTDLSHGLFFEDSDYLQYSK